MTGPNQKDDGVHDKLRRVIEDFPELKGGFVDLLAEAGRNAIEMPSGDSPFPPLDRDFDRAVVVGQRQFGVSSPIDPIILLTRGIHNSVGVAAFDHEHKLGFLSHSDALSFLYSEIGSKFSRELRRIVDDVHMLGCEWGNPRLSEHLQRLMFDLREKRGHQFSLDLTIARGPATTDETVAKIRDSIEYRKPANVEIASFCEVAIPDGTFGIDGRTGLLVSYDPSLDPEKREIPPHKTLNAFADWTLEGL